MISKVFKGLLALTFSACALGQQLVNIVVNQQLWNTFPKAEQASLLERFSSIEIVPAESVGVVQSVQTVNRSTAGTRGGAMLGGTLGSAVYIDRAFSGNNSYSATAQVGAALLGAALGSTLDSAPKALFVFNYAIKTADGQLREVRVESGEEFTRPVGQCVRIPSVVQVDAALCSMDKAAFVQKLSAIGTAPADALISRELSGISVNCRVPGVGLMTLEKNACLQMDGKVE